MHSSTMIILCNIYLTIKYGFLPLETTLAGSFQETLGYAECIRLAWKNHLTGFDFTQSTQTISFSLTDKPLHIHSHHITTISSLELRVHVPTYIQYTHINALFVLMTVNLTRYCACLKKSEAHYNPFHHLSDLFVIIHICKIVYIEMNACCTL